MQYSVGRGTDGIIRITISGHLDDASFMRCCDEIEAVYKTIAKPFAIVIDVSLLDMFGVERRRRLADLEEKYREVDRRFNRGQVYVARNPVIRGAVTAIQWVSKPVYPVTVFANEKEAEVWARHQLENQDARPQRRA